MLLQLPFFFFIASVEKLLHITPDQGRKREKKVKTQNSIKLISEPKTKAAVFLTCDLISLQWSIANNWTVV